MLSSRRQEATTDDSPISHLYARRENSRSKPSVKVGDEIAQ
jgi:hypothetical protein